MKKYPLIGLFLIISVLSMSAAFRSAALGTQTGGADPSSISSPAEVNDAQTGRTVVLQAASGATITFWTQNGRTIKDNPPQRMEIPHLVLKRNGALTPVEERTLLLSLAGIQTPSSGVTVTLTVETQHDKPESLGGKQAIKVWQETRRIAPDPSGSRESASVQFNLEFDQHLSIANGTIPTPTDYFRYAITLTDDEHPASNPLIQLNQDYAFLIENQIITPLPKVGGDNGAAAPDELIIYYYDMFPYQTNAYAPETQIPRGEVGGYVQAELIPALIEAFRVQTELWGFEWYPDWKSYRPGEKEGRLSVALSDGTTWFHGRAPSIGHSGISIKVKPGYGENGRYSSLTEKLIGTYHHELFHNHQRGISLRLSGAEDVTGKDKAWQFFTEGTAILAASVGQPEFQFSQNAGVRDYLNSANNFIIEDLNKSYAKINPYHAALYWRFLYEKCGGLDLGQENPARGMQVIQRALETLYSGKAVDIHSTTAVVENIDKIMDMVLEDSPCPFQSFEESQTAFARAIYNLRLEDERSATPTADQDVFYDPDDLYEEPEVDTVHYTTEPQTFTGSIGSSFGMDFVEVVLEDSLDSQPLTLEFQAAPNGSAQFNVQVIKLEESSEDAASPTKVDPRDESQELIFENQAGRLIYILPEVNSAEFDRLALIITRLDSLESADPFGGYTIGIR